MDNIENCDFIELPVTLGAITRNEYGVNLSFYQRGIDPGQQSFANLHFTLDEAAEVEYHEPGTEFDLILCPRERDNLSNE